MPGGAPVGAHLRIASQCMHALHARRTGFRSAPGAQEVPAAQDASYTPGASTRRWLRTSPFTSCPLQIKMHTKGVWRAGLLRAQEALGAQNASYAPGGAPLCGAVTLGAGRDAAVLDLGGLAERLWAVELAALHGAAAHAAAEERRRCARPLPGSASLGMDWVCCVFHQACLKLGMVR